ncbi:MAG: polysaccharide biosynthesis protein [Lachnospiraceae bacterium]|nr:polysaccharide biosynthesis protein [Lachnospiraceae bacterium]
MAGSTKPKTNAKKAILVQGGILAGAGLITKIIGFLYRIPMGNILGEQGNGIYTVSFGIYNIALTLSSYSMPLAVSKTVSARLAKGEYKNARRVFTDAMILALIVGVIAMSVLFFGADALEALYKRQGLARPLRILAPTTFVVALLGVFRGYFQGHSNMVPTALSQIIEQIFNAIVSVAASYGFVRMYKETADAASYGAVGGTMGTLCGAAAALVYFVILYVLTRKNEPVSDEKAQSHAMIYKALILTILPVILSQTIYQIGYTLDDMIYGNIMALKNYEEVAAASMQGVFNTQYNQLINLPVAISTALASATLPSMVASRMMRRKKEVFAKITLVVKVNMLIAFPSAVGMAVLATPIMKLLFPRLVTYQHLASMLLVTGSSAIIFYALSTITTSVLQGNDHMRIPVIHCGISLVIHVILVAVLLYVTDWTVYALIIGNVSFPLIVSVLNCRSIAKKLSYRFDLLQLFGKPLVSSLAMGVVTFLSYQAVFWLIHSYLIATAVSVILSIASYAFMILFTGCMTKEELTQLPGGRKLAAKLR